jgi:hypothetical protein
VALSRSLIGRRLSRRAKAILRTRPIYHSGDAAIAGHVFCTFLALMLQKEVVDLFQSHDLVVEWADLLRNLDRLQQATIDKAGKRITTRTAVAGQVGRVFQASASHCRPICTKTPPNSPPRPSGCSANIRNRRRKLLR